jgi:hypothetical protein
MKTFCPASFRKAIPGGQRQEDQRPSLPRAAISTLHPTLLALHWLRVLSVGMRGAKRIGCRSLKSVGRSGVESIGCRIVESVGSRSLKSVGGKSSSPGEQRQEDRRPSLSFLLPPSRPPAGRDTRLVSPATLEATQGQINGFFSQLPYECPFEEVASVRD